MGKYDPNKIEKKWQKFWEGHSELFVADEKSKKEKQYILDMFPYPSADGLHAGHVESYTATDIISRYLRMRGKNVLHPQGWDAFGLPAENFAIQTKTHPSITTQRAIATFKKQMRLLGLSYDWSREVSSSDPKYYKWTQWFFLLLYKNGLAYRAKAKVNWCQNCQTVLANEQAEGGICERCKKEVVQKDLEQWFFKITDFIENRGKTSGLLSGLDKIDWPGHTKAAQRNWIGRSEGTEIIFSIKNSDKKINIVTTRADTIFGATFLVLAPEHPLISELWGSIKNTDQVKRYINEASKKSDFERGLLSKDKTGVKLEGITAVNPANNKEIPVYISDFVLITYGTGAIMSVPGHDQRDFDFAKKFKIQIILVLEKPKNLNLPILVQIYDEDNTELASEVRKMGVAREYATPDVRVYGVERTKAKELIRILREEGLGATSDYKKIEEGAGFTLEFSPPKLNFLQVYEGDGIHINSEFLDGLKIDNAIEKMTKWLSEREIGWPAVHYRLRDWLVSRQRYWGAPIPIIYCDSCGAVPVPEKDLPVLLPDDVDFMPHGESPLARSKKFHDVKCPKCRANAKRESDTMDTFVCSSWYYFRYADPKNEKEFASKKQIKKWLPVDLYVGGAEHTVLHLLYARFFAKVLHKLGLINFDEPFLKLRHQGIVLAEDGRKMSKSLGNVINPDDVVAQYGADALRMFEMFMGPLEDMKKWDTRGIMGIYRFLERVWRLKSQIPTPKPQTNPKSQIPNLLHKTIKKVTEDIEELRFNTAIAAMMTLANEFHKEKEIAQEDFEKFILLLSPFAPHMAEELWSQLGHKESIFKEKWPEYDKNLVEDETIELVIQINGKLRDKIQVASDISEQDAKSQALSSEKVKTILAGREPKKVIFVKGKLVNIVI